MKSKACKHCGLDFTPLSSGHAYCTPTCWKDATRSHRRKYQRTWFATHPEYARENYHERVVSDPGWGARKSRRKNYGLTDEAYQAMLVGQDGRCAICRRTPEEASQKWSLHVDHDHATCAVRGLLCHRCNVNLGRLEWFNEFSNQIAHYLGGSK